MTLSNFIEQCEGRGILATLARAVINSTGGWASFKESAPDITNHGADGGFGGFIYYSDTLPFARRNLSSILSMAATQAQEYGAGSVAEMIAGFNCLKDYSAFEVEKVLMHPRQDGDNSTQILNALAWYALEEVARAYSDQLEAA